MATPPLNPAQFEVPSGLGEARPAFVSSPKTGATGTPQIPTMQPKQFGTMSNWDTPPPSETHSALITPPAAVG